MRPVAYTIPCRESAGKESSDGREGMTPNRERADMVPAPGDRPDEPKPPGGRRRRGVSLAGRILLTALLLGVLLSQVDVSRAWQVIRQVSLWWLLPIFVVQVADRWLMAWKWRFLLDARADRIGTLRAFKIYYIASFQGVIVPGGLGVDLVRFLRLRGSGIPQERVAASLLVERAVGMAASGLAAAFSFLLFLWLVGGGAPGWMLPALVAVVAGVVASLLFLASEAFRRRLGRLPGVRNALRKWGTSPWWRAVSAYQGRTRVLLRFFFWSVVEQYMYVLAIWFGGIALGLPLGLWACVAAVPITALLERVPLTIMGLGIREGALVFLLGLLGIGYSEAILLSLLQFTVFLASLVPGGIWDVLSARARGPGSHPASES